MTDEGQLQLTIELGRTELSRGAAQQLAAGMVVPLDKLADDLVDVFLNGQLVARGEIVVVDGSFCVRVVELTAARKAA
ncbi:MAG: FliM/FliN family flagellar motor switch protein [Pirellulales bacterium]